MDKRTANTFRQMMWEMRKSKIESFGNSRKRHENKLGDLFFAFLFSFCFVWCVRVCWAGVWDSFVMQNRSIGSIGEKKVNCARYQIAINLTTSINEFWRLPQCFLCVCVTSRNLWSVGRSYAINKWMKLEMASYSNIELPIRASTFIFILYLSSYRAPLPIRDFNSSRRSLWYAMANAYVWFLRSFFFSADH